MHKKNNFNILYLFSLIILLLFSGCGEISNPQIQNSEVWIFLTIRYDTNDDYNFDYYFGTVDEDLYQKISENRINQGFITLKNVRFWNNDNKIDIYEDEQDSGTRTYRIEDIREIKLKKGDPIYTYPDSDLSENTKRFVDKNPKSFLDSLIQK